MTALGPVTVTRVYLTSFACGVSRHPADATLALDGQFTTQATRLVCLAGGQRSFAHAEMLLAELCGWHVSDERIRQAYHGEAEHVAAWRAEPTRPTRPPSSHPLEFQVDAIKVNTDTGWRDMKIGVFARRPLGPPCSPDPWDQRTLPKPTARLAFAAIEEIDRFAPR